MKNKKQDSLEKITIRQLRSHYRSGKANLGQDFFRPCLTHCIQYRRAVGYFSSGALVSWAEAISNIATNDVKIKLIISPTLSEEDQVSLEKAVDESECKKLRQIIADQIIKDALSLSEKPYSIELRQKILAWMVAHEKLILRFAFPVHIEQAGLFHEKIGIFSFPWDDCVAFTGSANESINGYSRNYESIDVYRSWLSEDEKRVKIKTEEFEEAWSGKAVGLKMLSLSKQAMELIRAYAPIEKPSIQSENSNLYSTKEAELPDSPSFHKLTVSNNQWRHQEEALEKFIKVEHGVLEMATGTGKTRTTLKILSKLDEQGRIDGIIISTIGNDLLDQWSKEVDRWSIQRPQPFRVLKHYESHHQLESFINNPKRAIIIINREKLATLLPKLKPEIKKRLIIVHDEVHGLGSLSIRQQLAGQHHDFRYRLGLSATPEREYDQEGSQFIFDEIGDIFFQFELKEAIEQGILCEFDYIPLSYELTDIDRQRIQQIYKKKAIRQREGQPMTETEVWIEISKVYKTAEQKLEVFRDFLKTNNQFLKSTIIFIENIAYGKRLLDEIHNYTHRYRTYYSGEDKRSLKEFAEGKIDCLITCHRLSQGIDIKNLQNVILFSSARAKLETIQRIGRCLRINPEFPNKRATIVDFVLQCNDTEGNVSIDQERYQWLSELCQIRRKN
ncbi:MAG TPA: DEAD/DEAH box helicase family protein [Candidatus Obscuribacterales bacterium]